MFIAFFDDCPVKNGVVTCRGLETMVAILEKARVEVTVEELFSRLGFLPASVHNISVNNVASLACLSCTLGGM